MSHALARRTIAGGAALASVALAVATPAHAALPGTNGSKIAYTVDTDMYVANPDGSSAKLLAADGMLASWSPDGSRIAYSSTSPDATKYGIWTVRPDGTAPVQLTTMQFDRSPAWTPDGSTVIFTRDGVLASVASDGNWQPVSLNENPDTQKYSDTEPAISKNNDLVFVRSQSGVDPVIYRYNPSDPGNPTLLLSSATDPDFSPDGTKIAYTVPAQPVTDTQVWIANADGTNPTKLTADSNGATQPAWSPDGKSILYTDGTGSGPLQGKRIDLANNNQVTTVVADGGQLAWQPVRQNYVDRVWGQNAVGTAIAASQWNYRDNGNTADTVRSQANAVVLSRADAFYDALAGSALAINKKAPLLITYPSALDTNVQAEIKRVLGTSGTVYLLGGTAALPAAIADKLTSLGYTVKRVAGATAIETAIEVDKQITSTPTTTIVATASEYYDALAAGAAAGAHPGTTIVLTWGDYMPDASATYLNALNPDPNATGGTTIVAAGGPGDRALASANLPSWPANAQYFSLVGANAKDTALLLAKFFFSAPPVAAVATSAGWYDALTGGAMIGAAGGPLLLTDPTGLYGPVADYLSADSGGMWDGVILGGTAALPDTLKAPIGEAISLAGGNPPYWTYTSIQPGSVTPSARSLTAQSTSTATASTGRAAADRQATTAPPGISRTAATTVTR